MATSLSEELMRRLPARASDPMREALRVALDIPVGVDNKRTAIAARTELSPAGQALELTRFVNSQPKSTIADLRARVDRAKVALEARKRELMPAQPTTSPDELRNREVRDVLRELPPGEAVQILLDADKPTLQAALLAPLPFRFMNAELMQRLVEAFAGADVIAAIESEAEAIDMVTAALDRAEAVVAQVENFARAQQAAAPDLQAAIVNIRRAV